jgi:hypothetical protein
LADEQKRLWIWVCGPYAAESDAERAGHLRALHKAAHAVFGAGHVPIIGIVNALPVIEIDGSDPVALAIRKPLSEALMLRCDACLRVGGPSQGADREVQWFSEQGRPVYRSITEVTPGAPW